MNGNYPYAGQSGNTPAGQRAADDVPELTLDQKRALRDGLSGIASRTREYLPDEYVVGSEISSGTSGPEAMVAVQPPIGHPVSAGLSPDIDDIEAGIDEDDRKEVAQGLAASAALQVKQAIQDDVTPTAR